MSNSIAEQIVLEVVSRLEQITIANSYAFDVADVSRVQRDGSQWTPKNYSVAVKEVTDSRIPELDHEGNPPAVAWQLVLEIGGFIRLADRTGTTQQTKLNNFAASIRKAITNSATWMEFGSLAVDADFGETQLTESDTGEYSLAIVPLLVVYRVDETDPFTARQ